VHVASQFVAVKDVTLLACTDVKMPSPHLDRVAKNQRVENCFALSTPAIALHWDAVSTRGRTPTSGPHERHVPTTHALCVGA
jgi:hypothetical protein